MPKVKPQPKNHLRKTIADRNLLKYIDKVNISERNRKIIIDYMNGVSMSELAREHGISSPRVRQIIYIFIRYCNGLKQ